MDKQGNVGSIILAFAIGGLIGVGVTLLMAPQSGEKTRSLILDKSSDLRDRAAGTVEDTRTRAGKAIGDLSNQAKDRVSTFTNRSQEMLSDQKANIEAGVNNARNTMHIE
ncbi:MAG TPA: YtxH domain-containing protein [Anaerolineales bacterium]